LTITFCEKFRIAGENQERALVPAMGKARTELPGKLRREKPYLTLPDQRSVKCQI
jgi:hypothetical protein